MEKVSSTSVLRPSGRCDMHEELLTNSCLIRRHEAACSTLWHLLEDTAAPKPPVEMHDIFLAVDCSTEFATTSRISVKQFQLRIMFIAAARDVDIPR